MSEENKELTPKEAQDKKVKERIESLIEMSEITVRTCSLANNAIQLNTNLLLRFRAHMKEEDDMKISMEINKMHVEFNKQSEKINALLEKINK
tara:strand:- start:493 stop:771 length:279 start_codon:yes stop_codon:yes gene_type:complete